MNCYNLKIALVIFISNILYEGVRSHGDEYDIHGSGA